MPDDLNELPDDCDEIESPTPEEMDEHFAGLEPGRGRTDRHNDDAEFLALVDYASPILEHFEKVHPLPAGSASWQDRQNRNRTIWKINFYNDVPWLFGVRRDVARQCGRLRAIGLTTEFTVQGVEFVGFAVANDEESKAKILALVQAVPRV